MYIGYNPCANNNGGCAHLCLLSSNHPDGYTCACHSGSRLHMNKKNCIPGKIHVITLATLTVSMRWINYFMAQEIL